MISPLEHALIQRTAGSFAKPQGMPHMKGLSLPKFAGPKAGAPEIRPFQRPIMSGLRPSALMPRIGM